MSKLKNKVKKKLDNYFLNMNLNESCYFSENKVVGFHWSNDKCVSDYFKKLYKSSDEKFEERVNVLEENIKDIKNQNIWLMSKRGQLKISLYDLYACYLDPCLRHQWFEMEDILVSLNHESGPFSSIKSMRWFNKDTYSKLIYLKMLDSFVGQRTFRLSLDIPVDIRADGSRLGAIGGRISQINSSGILLEIYKAAPTTHWAQKKIFFIKKKLALVEESGINDILKTTKWMNTIENFTMSADVFIRKLTESTKNGATNNQFIFVGFEELTMLSIQNHQASVDSLKSLFSDVEQSIHTYIKAA